MERQPEKRRLEPSPCAWQAPLPVVGVGIAPHPHHAVAMRQPSQPEFGGARGREAVRESDFRSVDIAVGQPGKALVQRQGRIEFGLEIAHAGRNGVPVVGITPLRHVIVLHSQHR